MDISLETVEVWLTKSEKEGLEFKAARANFDARELARYCIAIANEGGGYLVLGITDSSPRQVVGTTVRPDMHLLHQRVPQITVHNQEIGHPKGRVLVFIIPSRPLGVPLQCEGSYLRREGESLVAMRPDELERIFSETGPDFSSMICEGASLDDLDPDAITEFQRRWVQKSGNDVLFSLDMDQLLEDAELTVDGKVTYAALVLLGTRRALGRYLAQAEVIFEYRSSDVPGAAQERVEFRQGLFAFYDQLWELINKRNDRLSYQDGLFVLDLETFNERAVREALLNAVAHRDYRLGGSVFVRQYPRRIEFVSPGGFPAGITEANVLDRQSPRNRRIAEALSRCGLVERAGQGMNLIWESCLRESKPRPDFQGTDAFQVSLTLHGDVQNPRFLRFLERIRTETSYVFSLPDLLVLDAIAHRRRVPEDRRSRLLLLQRHGLVEPVGHGRWVLSRRFYGFLGEPGTYTRVKGLDHETNKALLLKHISDCGDEGAPMVELGQVLPELGRAKIKLLLQELRRDGKIHLQGQRRGSRWHRAEE